MTTQLDYTEQSMFLGPGVGGLPWLPPPSPTAPRPASSSEQGCHQTHWLPSSEMNSAPSNYSSSSSRPLFKGFVLWPSMAHQLPN